MATNTKLIALKPNDDSRAIVKKKRFFVVVVDFLCISLSSAV